MHPRRSPRAQDRTDVAVRITDARTPLAQDVAARSRRYLLQMSIRVICFVGAVTVDHWTRWLLLAGAVVLPYVAVVLATAGRERSQDPGTFLAPPALPGPAPTAGVGPGPAGGHP